MARFVHGRLTFANVMSVLAVFIALGGVAYAGSKIKGSEIARNAIRGKHVANHSLGRADIREKSLKLARAWAEITPGGGVRNAHGIKASQVTHPTTEQPAGVYCIALKARNAAATPGLAPGLGVTDVAIYSRASLLDQGISPSQYGCPQSTAWTVLTHQDAVLTNGYFQVVFH